MFWKDDIPIVEKEGVKITIIAGSFGETKALKPSPNSWAVNPENEVQIWRIELEVGGSFEIPKADIEVNRSLYFFEGDWASIAGKKIESQYGSDLAGDETISVQNSGSQKACFLFLQGRPIQEDYIRNGPFIAANRNEMQKVISEYQRTQFGGWKWETSGPVFGNEKKRFSTNEA